MRIAEISPENRPRERLKREGIDVLSDAEILAVILQKGSREENVIDMSNRLISTYGMNKLSSCSLTELQQIKGIGEAKAMQILAAFELEKRVLKNLKIYMNNPEDVFSRLKWLQKEKQEKFIVIALDSQNKIIDQKEIFAGTLDNTTIHPREIFKFVVKNSAHSFIIVHNHPSGSAEPSMEDIKITEQIDKLSKTMDIRLKDHIIIGEDYWSWKLS